MADDEDEGGYELLVPFVCCESEEGPYEDISFCAGVQYGMLRGSLVWHQAFETNGDIDWHPMPKALAKQLDLLGMEFGYEVEFEPVEDDEFENDVFVNVRFVKN